MSNYLIDSWSYSKVSCFARNEKAFEMLYVYGEKERRSASSIAGNAYHAALAMYFRNFGKKEVSLVEMTDLAYSYIEDVPANEWKLTSKLSTVELARAEANKAATALIQNFLSEVEIYIEDIDHVVAVEERIEEWVIINGVDIPLPLHAILDLVVVLKDGRVVIIDHKSKSAFTDLTEATLVHGKQAITYVAAWEARHPDMPVAEVWFIENKISKNRDGSGQLVKHTFTMDPDSRRLHEAMLYEPLRNMLNAVSDPDYVYTINDSDNLCDKAALYDFWARTQLAEVEDFHVPEDKKELIERRQRKIKDTSIQTISPKVITAFRKKAASFITYDYSNTDMTNSEKIEHILRTFNISVEVAHEIEGFSCDTYLCSVAAGTDIKNLSRHNLEIAYALDVPNVRIANELEVYENKSYVSIEVTKKRTETLLWEPSLLKGHKIPLGLDNFRRPVVWDLDNHATPHALVCGSTGSGKSVCLRSTLAYVKESGVDDIIIFDPKFEFADINIDDAGIRVYSEIDDLEKVLADLVLEMERRIRAREKKLTFVIFDEFADAMQQSRSGKELNPGEKSLMENLQRLLQKGRSCGFRFMLGTQRASTKVVSGDIKVNFPVLICFRVAKAIDSKVVLDEDGAQMLGGSGDGLLRSPEYMDRLVRFQGFYKE